MEIENYYDHVEEENNSLPKYNIKIIAGVIAIIIILIIAFLLISTPTQPKKFH